MTFGSTILCKYLRGAIKAGIVVLIAMAAIPTRAQMSLNEVKPGMARGRVVQGLSEHYTQEGGYKLGNDKESTSVSRWIEKDGKVKSVTQLGLVIYKAGRVEIVEEYYDPGSTERATDAIRDMLNEIQACLKAEAPPKGHQLRQVGTAHIVLDELLTPERGETSRSLFVMVGDRGVRVTLTNWKIGSEEGTYVELARRREFIADSVLHK